MYLTNSGCLLVLKEGTVVLIPRTSHVTLVVFKKARVTDRLEIISACSFQSNMVAI